MMKKITVLLFVLAVTLAFVAQPIFAGGDKVRGDESEGPSNQYGECPFTG